MALQAVERWGKGSVIEPHPDQIARIYRPGLASAKRAVRPGSIQTAPIQLAGEWASAGLSRSCTSIVSPSWKKPILLPDGDTLSSP